MAFKLTRSEESQRQELIETLRSKTDAFTEGQTTWAEAEDREAKEKARQQLSVLLAEVLVTIQEAETFRDEVATRLRDEYDEKSEKWQESDKGSEADDMVNEWENQSFDEPDLEDPTTLELEDFASILEELPDAAG